jgi:hypothetical protein
VRAAARASRRATRCSGFTASPSKATPASFSATTRPTPRLFGGDTVAAGAPDYFNDAFHNAVVGNDPSAVNPARAGTKAALRYRRTVLPGGTWQLGLRRDALPLPEPFPAFVPTMRLRRDEADTF